LKKENDILVMLSSLSNHEIFTPPNIANDMLDLLPEEVWSKPEYKFLDPAVKTGVFLRECLVRLDKGLNGLGKHIGFDKIEYNLNNRQERINHILKNMLFGIAISELTGYITRRTLYGVMNANSDKETEALNVKINSDSYKRETSEEQTKYLEETSFNDYYDRNIFLKDDNYIGLEKEGNIFYPSNEVTIENEDIVFPFINEVKHGKINEIKEDKMKIDVIIGNPPYQMEVGETSAKPIYNLFIENSINLNPKYISMIIPSRWMIGGKGLDSFRTMMLNNKNLKKIIDFKDASKCFPTVDIEGGINYFLWEKDYNGNCKFNNIKRDLSKYDILIRNNNVIPILNKILKIENNFIYNKILGSNPFNINTNFKNYKINKFNNSIKMYGNKANMKRDKNILNGIGYIDFNLLNKNLNLINSFKVIVPAANGNNTNIIIGKPFISEPNSICTQTYILIDSFNNIKNANNLVKYIKSRFVRFLISIRKNTQHSKRDVYKYVPLLDMSLEWTDQMIYQRYNLTKEEIDYIESSIKEME
jgi:site-specific DNA-methyltransferase (adenine-specific)